MDDDIEGPRARVNREFGELLSELRVALPGVQIFFAFLLTVPFASRWTQVTGFQRGLFHVVLALSLISLASMLAPAAYHRMRFRDGVKERNVLVANWFIRAGLGTLALAATGAAVLVADFQFGTAAAATMGVFGIAVFAFCFVAVPLSDRRRELDGELPKLSVAGDVESAP